MKRSAEAQGKAAHLKIRHSADLRMECEGRGGGAKKAGGASELQGMGDPGLEVLHEDVGNPGY